MAKPIPVNRRWLRNQQQRQAHSASANPSTPAPPSNPLAGLIREALAIAQAAGAPMPSGAPTRANYTVYDDRVLVARYSQTCSGCGGQITPGMLITRHPLWGEWVHLECVHRQQRAVYRTLVARYPGFCRVCRRPIHPGQTITMHPLRGWVHGECALAGSDHR
ncbi:MAG: hypothetical protein NZ550_02030 [Fimbriimonadales bacterium]|nr:hypothetical protein [Fimbriimonadales bacterium]MDW8052408.1 hypothetical protein [Armatimonadota bacterium]